MKTNDTICAIATAQGGAISLIRISGSDAIDIAARVFTPRGTQSLHDKKSYTVTFGDVKDIRGEQLDEVLLTIMRAPHSYTGQDTVEISCHASSYITRELLIALIENGARQAEPGEFTMRAFMNGKMDLSRAEAVADVIAADSRSSHRLAMNQLKGGFSKQLKMLRDKLLQLTTLMELELDFSEEDVAFADRRELIALCVEIETIIANLTNSFSIGNAVKNGVPVAIVGEANTGKSTLLNALLNEDRAIVSDICGTTRDTIEGTMNVGGVAFRFIDTAGLRRTNDVVEQMGIERTLNQLSASSIALWVIDPMMNLDTMETAAKELLPLCKGKTLALLINKCDVVDAISLTRAMEWGTQMVQKHGNGIEWNSQNVWAISAKLGINMDRLEEFLVTAAAIPEVSAESVVVTNIRHFEALKKALSDIQRVHQGLQDQLSGDLVCEDLRQCIHHLSEIAGDVTTDDVLGNIFKNFCIGK